MISRHQIQQCGNTEAHWNTDNTIGNLKCQVQAVGFDACTVLGFGFASV